MSSIPDSGEPAGGASLLSVRDLRVRFGKEPYGVEAVRGVSFDVGREKVAIVGESGSGKSTVGRTILKLHPPATQVTAGRMTFMGEDLVAADEAQMRKLRGRRMSMILQDPKFSLNPVMRVGDQVAETYRISQRTSKAQAKAHALDMLKAVQIRDPERVYDMYPHQVSGGMGQRIMIAMMLVSEPDLVIADEPTSALDVTVRLQVLAILDDLVQSRGVGLIFISHDLNLVRSFCDRVLVMYSGVIVESLKASELDQAQHPYTRGLLGALPRIDQPRRRLPVLQRDPLWASV